MGDEFAGRSGGLYQYFMGWDGSWAAKRDDERGSPITSSLLASFSYCQPPVPIRGGNGERPIDRDASLGALRLLDASSSVHILYRGK